MTIGELLALGLQYHRAGDLESAECAYQQLLAVEPNQADALHLLGVVFLQRGNHRSATEYLERAAKQEPNRAEFHNDLGAVLHHQGRLNEAIACYQRAVQLQPDYANAHVNLANVYKAQGKLEEAVACYNRAINLRPDHAEAYNGLGNALHLQGRFREAAASFHRSARLNPSNADPHYNWGNSLREQGDLNGAIACYRQALQRNPNLAEAHNNLGNAFHHQGHLDQAAAFFRRALELKPGFAEALNNLGNTVKDQGTLDEAVDCFTRALELTPDSAELHNNLGNAFKDQSRPDDAIRCYRKALQLSPNYASAHSNLICTLQFDPGCGKETIDEELRCWAAQHAPAVTSFPSHSNDRLPDRRLRLGYISPDLRDHVVGRNVWPLLRNHDHDRFHITLYANLTCPDRMSEQFRECADNWRAIAASTDEQVADRIRQDGIDILVDLAVHTSGHRLLVFAQKPAPVQVTFAGYPGSTGLAAIDYRLTDPQLDPPGENGDWHAETVYRLPHTFWCYDPAGEAPEVGPLPAWQTGFITFGCLNNFCKVNDQVLALWARTLPAVDGSRLLLLAKEGSHRQRTIDFLADHGIAPGRVTFCSPQPRAAYLSLYHQIDIGLDTFPYNGHTTSLDSFWMGAPVITLAGNTAVGRAGISQLTNLGLEELVARTPDEFVGITAQLAGDLPRLDSLRKGLRGRMEESALMDARGFARDIETAYRDMWRRWCESSAPGTMRISSRG